MNHGDDVRGMNGDETVHGAAVVSGTHITIAQKREPQDPLTDAARQTTLSGNLRGVTINNGGHTVSGMNGDEDLGQSARVSGTNVNYAPNIK